VIYFYVSVAYTVTNLALAVTLLRKTRGSLIGKFYFFCVCCLVIFGVSAYCLSRRYLLLARPEMEALTVFLFSLLPFFFLHFLVLFLRRYDVLKSNYVIFAIYFAGLFSYATVLGGLIPQPVSETGVISAAGYIYYVTWMSVFFSIGIALLYSLVEGFSEHRMKSNLLLTGFALLMLVLPSPFTDSIFYLIFGKNTEIYTVTSTLSLIVAIYLIFRHKIMVTVYDAIKSALVVMNDIFILTDDRFRIRVIRGALDMLGYTEKELIGKSLNDIIVEKQYIENYLEYAATRRMKECLFDAQVIAKSGGELVIDFSFSPIFESDQLIGFVGVARDITHKKRMEIALRASEERFRRLAENAEDIIYQYRFQPDRGFDYISPAVTEITGYAPGEFYADPGLILDIVHPEDRQLMEKYLDGEGIFYQIVSIRFVSRDGDVVWTEQRNVPIYDTDGSLTAMEGIARDVTDRKKLEEQLLQAQKLESIGTLAGGVAHDFNNILAIILGYISILRNHRHNDELFDEHIQVVQKAVKRGAGVVRELLTLARKTDTTFEPVSIGATLDELLSFLRNTFSKKIEITLRYDKELPSILADPNQLSQTLLNLCINARDAMPDGGNLSINASLVSGADLHEQFPGIRDDPYCCISVKDSGVGMSKEVANRIFEPFFTTKELGKGTGLGLAVVYGIVKSHGGFINVESEVGKGTTFLIYLPVHNVAPEIVTEAAPEQLVGGKETILLVEDEDMLLNLVKAVLEEQGYHVIPAKDGQDAVEIYSHYKEVIDVVLSDVGLPHIGGWELYRHIHDINPNVPMILASGFFDPSLQSEMSKIGAKYFIQKPYDNEIVLRKVREAIASKETA
jgi:PAS domain S-box-containing protein